MAYCKVGGCRYAASHATVAHRCGKCRGYGHGQMECDNLSAIRSLSFYFQETIPFDERCNEPMCDNRASHTADGHTCVLCDGFCGTHLKRCPNGDRKVSITDDPLSIGFDPRPNAESQNIEPGHYITFYGGMGCAWYARRNTMNPNGGLEYFFMHSDCYGQYGDDSSDMPRMRAFIRGYKMQEIRDDFSPENQLNFNKNRVETTT